MVVVLLVRAVFGEGHSTSRAESYILEGARLDGEAKHVVVVSQFLLWYSSYLSTIISKKSADLRNVFPN